MEKEGGDKKRPTVEGKKFDQSETLHSERKTGGSENIAIEKVVKDES